MAVNPQCLRIEINGVDATHCITQVDYLIRPDDRPSATLRFTSGVRIIDTRTGLVMLDLDPTLEAST